MASSADKLTPLQRDLLSAFFVFERRFFLTGGAALAGFYLQHRTTDDLDFFTHEADAFDAAGRALGAAADRAGATLTTRQDTPGFRRYVATRGDAVVVDLVWERVPSAYPNKVEQAGIRIDRPEKILINKLTAIVSRSEERDIVDVMFLERAGHRVEAALPGALAKDGGCTPAALAFVLSEVALPDTATLPASVSPGELRAFISDLIVRLRRAAVPGA